MVPYQPNRDDANAQLHAIAILKAPLATDAMHHFIVQRDANVSGENAMAEPITEKCALYSRLIHEIRSRFVHFLCRHAWANQLADSVENVPRRPAGLSHFLNFLRV